MHKAEGGFRYIMRGMNAISRDKLTELLEGRRIKPRLRRELRFVPEEITDWQNRDFLAIMNRSQSEGVLVAPLDRLYTIPFQLRPRTANSAGRVEAIICDFCATWQRGSSSAVISFQKPASSVSFLCCGDLLCSFHVRGKTAQAVLSRTQIREDISPQRRIERLRQKLQKLAKEMS